MKRHYLSIFVLAILGICRGQQASVLAAEGGAGATKGMTRVIELSQQTLIFQPTRDDFTVGTVVFSVGQPPPVHLEGIRINGAVPKRSELYLKRLEKNRFELPALKIEYSNEALGGPLYLTLKVWFEGISNQGDSSYYQSLPDRYALLTYCTNEGEDPAKVNARWGANRAVTLKEFKEKLARPLRIKMNREPLRVGSGYPMVNDSYNLLRDTDVKALQELMRKRDEKCVLAINVVDADRANVHTSVNDYTQFYGRRLYEAVKVEGAWRIESVETVKNGF